ncbi:hypothetical protein O181_024136 [Austropuccinia psidii MF-1]|uniref:RNA-directed DNA polymerase n=1 Tax=Austropuccinia psidii MF-1 TaxID=1389203 RepID=A0A9Q3GYB7_9BASI|nr:hypothetical protein [Austropuccinia psidii MF-1]
MKAPDSFDGIQAHKLRGVIQSCQFTFHNDTKYFFSDRKKFPYSTDFLTGRAGKWIEPYISNIPNEDPSYLLKNLQLCETQLFTLFGDPNEVRKAEQKLRNLRMKESGHVSFFEWDFFIIDSPKGEDLILGYDFLYHFNPIIDWKHGLITYDSSHKDSSGIKSSTSNDSDTSVNSVALWDEQEEPEEVKTVFKVVPPAYHQYLDVFSKVKAEKHPPHGTCDHHTKLEGLLPPIIEKGFIRPRSSSTGAPVLFVKKKDKGLIFCVDYHKLNAVTRNNRYPVPPMNQILTVFNGSTIFSKIDLCGVYDILRIKEGDEHLTAFRPKYGSYEYLVMPFGITNAPASFHSFLNDIFSEFLHIFVVVYLDSIMVFSSSEYGHVRHVASVLQRLRYNNLFFQASKCVFHASSVEYLGYVVSSDGLKMDSSNVQKITNWPQPFNLSLDLPISLVFSLEMTPKKHCSHFPPPKRLFNEEYLSQFQILKEAFTTAPVPSHLNPSIPPIVEMDTSDYSLGAVLSQVKDSEKHPISFDSCKLLPAELNYEIHDKELLGIVWDLKCLRAFLLSLSNPFEVLTDHSFLQYFMSSKVLTCCRLANLPDALSNQEDVYPERGVDFISKNPQNFHQIIKQDGIKGSVLFSIKVETFSYLVEQIKKEAWQYKH